MEIPLHCPCPQGQAGTGLLAVTIAQGRHDPLPMSVAASDRGGGAGRLRARRGGKKVCAGLTQLTDRSATGPARVAGAQSDKRRRRCENCPVVVA